MTPHSFDRASAVEHPRRVVRLIQRLSACVLTLALIGGNAAVCAGWMPSPEARMACCADGGKCSVHQDDSHRSGPRRVQKRGDMLDFPSERPVVDRLVGL